MCASRWHSKPSFKVTRNPEHYILHQHFILPILILFIAHVFEKSPVLGVNKDVHRHLLCDSSWLVSWTGRSWARTASFFTFFLIALPFVFDGQSLCWHLICFTAKTRNDHHWGISVADANIGYISTKVSASSSVHTGHDMPTVHHNLYIHCLCWYCPQIMCWAGCDWPKSKWVGNKVANVCAKVVTMKIQVESI